MNNKHLDQLKERNKKCSHCLGDLTITNPTGYCDHSNYPENCSTCEKRDPNISYTTANNIGKRHGK